MRLLVFIAWRRPWGRLATLVTAGIPVGAILLLALARTPTFTLTVQLQHPSQVDRVQVFADYWPADPGAAGTIVSGTPFATRTVNGTAPVIFLLPRGGYTVTASPSDEGLAADVRLERRDVRLDRDVAITIGRDPNAPWCDMGDPRYWMSAGCPSLPCPTFISGPGATASPRERCRAALPAAHSVALLTVEERQMRMRSARYRRDLELVAVAPAAVLVTFFPCHVD